MNTQASGCKQNDHVTQSDAGFSHVKTAGENGTITGVCAASSRTNSNDKTPEQQNSKPVTADNKNSHISISIATFLQRPDSSVDLSHIGYN